VKKVLDCKLGEAEKKSVRIIRREGGDVGGGRIKGAEGES
jgi:hypothetical protein